MVKGRSGCYSHLIGAPGREREGPSMNRLVGAILVVALGAAGAGAQTTQTYWTLEARIARADGVVRGTISKLSRKVIVAPGGQSPDGVSWPDGIVEYTATVKV